MPILQQKLMNTKHALIGTVNHAQKYRRLEYQIRKTTYLRFSLNVNKYQRIPSNVKKRKGKDYHYDCGYLLITARLPSNCQYCLWNYHKKIRDKVMSSRLPLYRFNYPRFPKTRYYAYISTKYY